MSIDQQLRDQLTRVTEHVEGGPDLQTSLRAGRRHRRTQRAALALGVAAVVGVGAVGLGVAVGGEHGSPTVASDHDRVAPADPGPADPAAPVDFVPGTDIDETMAATVADDLPALPAPDDVYPSDSDHAGPMPDAEFAAAEDWQAAYTTPTSQVLVMMSLAVESPGPFECPDCRHTAVPGGTIYHQQFTTTPDGGGDEYWFGTYFVHDDGSQVNAFESVVAGKPAQARAARVTDDAALEALVQDPRLTFAPAG